MIWGIPLDSHLNIRLLDSGNYVSKNKVIGVLVKMYVFLK